MQSSIEKCSVRRIFATLSNNSKRQVETPKTHWLNFSFFFSKRSLSLSLSFAYYTCKKRSRIKPTTEHHRHHHNILPIERGSERERTCMWYVFLLNLLLMMTTTIEYSKVLQTYPRMRERVSLKWMCAHANHCEKSQQENNKNKRRICEMNEMRQKNEHAREREFLYFKCNVNGN